MQNPAAFWPYGARGSKKYLQCPKITLIQEVFILFCFRIQSDLILPVFLSYIELCVEMNLVAFIYILHSCMLSKSNKMRNSSSLLLLHAHVKLLSPSIPPCLKLRVNRFLSFLNCHLDFSTNSQRVDHLKSLDFKDCTQERDPDEAFPISDHGSTNFV